MLRQNNYAITAENARKRFTTYDLDQILRKTPLTQDAQYLYLPVLDRICRIEKNTGKMAWQTPAGWDETTEFHTVLTIFDYLCDSKENRCCTGQMKAMSSFGHQFHTGLLEQSPPSELEQTIDQFPQRFRQACLRMGGTPFPQGDMAFTFRFFPDLPVTIQFWHSDEDFPPQLRCLWDAAATDFIRYETLFYALSMLKQRLTFWLDFNE